MGYSSELYMAMQYAEPSHAEELALHHQLTEEQLYTQYNEQPNTNQQANGICAAEDAVRGYPF